MKTVIVQSAASADHCAPLTLELERGQGITFGRGVSSCRVDLPLGDPAVSRLAGSVRAVEDYWLISNLSSEKTYIVENPEGGGEFVKVVPQREEMPVPFEFARVVLPGQRARVSFIVFAPQHTYADRNRLPDPGREDTRAAFSLDMTAKYFLVLVALCEARLRDAATVPIPSVSKIVSRLREVPGCGDISRTAVNFHIEYLARHKLRVKGSAGQEPSAKADWQREALVSLALRFDIVREEHLALLNETAGRSGRPARALPPQ